MTDRITLTAAPVVVAIPNPSHQQEVQRIDTGESPKNARDALLWPATPPRPPPQPSPTAVTPLQGKNPAWNGAVQITSDVSTWMTDAVASAESSASEGGPAVTPKVEIPETSTSPAASQPQSPSGTREVVFDLEDEAFSSDYFRMYEFKVKRCPRARPHDWTLCPFAHPGEKAKRRDPRRSKYSGAACPDFRKGYCKRGDGCHFAHGVFECWLHPSRYRTQMCTDGINCQRRVCFFAHREEEIRTPEEDPELIEAELAADAHRLQVQQSQQQKSQQDVAAALSTLMNAQLSSMQANPYLEVIKTLTNAMPGAAPGAEQMAALLGSQAQAQMSQTAAAGMHSQQLNQLQWLQQHQALVAAAEMQLRLSMQQQQQQQQQQLPSHHGQMLAQHMQAQQLAGAQSMGHLPAPHQEMMPIASPAGSPQPQRRKAPDAPPGLGLLASQHHLPDQQHVGQQLQPPGLSSASKQILTPIFETRQQMAPSEYRSMTPSHSSSNGFSSPEVGIGLGGLDLSSGIWSRRSEPGMADLEHEAHQRRQGLRYNSNPTGLANGMRRTWAGVPEGDLFNSLPPRPAMRSSETYETQRFGSEAPGGDPTRTRSSGDIGFSMNGLSISSPPFSPESVSRVSAPQVNSPSPQARHSGPLMGLHFSGMMDNEWAQPQSARGQSNAGW